MSSTGATTAPPSIILVLSDEHRGQAMGHAGDRNLRTPNMDRMAESGAGFRRAYANCPVCTPSRGTIFSGRHAHAGPVANFFAAYPQAAPSLATWLRQHGYHTSYIGKWHCGLVHDQVPDSVEANRDSFPGLPNRTPENRRAGFQDWAGFEVVNSPFETFVYRGRDESPEKLPGYQTDVLTDELLRQLERYERPEPLFAVLSVEPPHFPCIPPVPETRWDPDELAVSPNFARLNPMFAEIFPDLDEKILRQILCNYYAMIENLDVNLGRVLDLVRTDPRWENTLVVYISDHGDYVGSHGINTCKVTHHEESVRIPALFDFPAKIPARGSVDGLFGLVDLQATLCGLAGLPIPPWNQGYDWSHVLRGEPAETPETQLLEMCGVPRWNPRFIDWRGLVDKRWKYVFYEDGREFLHDLESDPFEMANLATSLPEQTRACRSRLLALLSQTREPFFDVIIRHGVTPEETRYILRPERLVSSTRRLGGLDLTPGPLPMA